MLNVCSNNVRRNKIGTIEFKDHNQWTICLPKILNSVLKFESTRERLQQGT